MSLLPKGGIDMELYNITATEAIESVVNTVLEVNPELSKKDAKKLVLNALIYNCVVDEIMGKEG